MHGFRMMPESPDFGDMPASEAAEFPRSQAIEIKTKMSTVWR
jgi:hypothetical protein